MILIPTRTLEQIRPRTPAERRAAWAWRYHLTRESLDAAVDMARTRRLKLTQTREKRHARP